MSARRRMPPLPPVDLSDRAAVAAWAAMGRGKVDAILPFALDATLEKSQRKNKRRVNREGITRILRDLHVLFDAISPRAPEASGEGAMMH